MKFNKLKLIYGILEGLALLIMISIIFILPLISTFHLLLIYFFSLLMYIIFENLYEKEKWE